MFQTLLAYTVNLTFCSFRIHMKEKSFRCGFCQNRFKNKNEAERHQKPLHLRLRSWSCGAISDYKAAFHPLISFESPNPNSASYDVCGYCGEKFSNIPRDWEIRIEYLPNCINLENAIKQKKFFRADHLRQHLKHSHASASGK